MFQSKISALVRELGKTRISVEGDHAASVCGSLESEYRADVPRVSVIYLSISPIYLHYNHFFCERGQS